MKHEKFNYADLCALRSAVSAAGLDLPLSDDLGVLARTVSVAGYDAPNTLAIHPMEGNDGQLDGSPSDLTKRRYERFAKSGAGLIWFEAVAVARDGRASPRQLWINEDNKNFFRALVEEIRTTAQNAFGSGFRPLIICQLTHSGRFSKPDGTPAPVISYHNPVFNSRLSIPPEHQVVTDEWLEALEDQMENAARLALEAGFDGVDLKACHRYICSELLSAYTRSGKYGGSFENRSRFLFNVAKRVSSAYGDNMLICSRLNASDAICPPYGFGTDKINPAKIDLNETQLIIEGLGERGVKLVNITMGTPYYNPHVNRPFDTGSYEAPEHPIEGVSRMLSGCGALAAANKEIAFVGTGFSWLRQFGANAAAGCIEKGYMAFAGFGRQSFAYPDFAVDIMQKGGMDAKKCCIACGKCSDIMRSGGPAGCVVRDGGLYAPYYKQFCV